MGLALAAPTVPGTLLGFAAAGLRTGLLLVPAAGLLVIVLAGALEPRRRRP
jgi:hypothetical protein